MEPVLAAVRVGAVAVQLCQCAAVKLLVVGSGDGCRVAGDGCAIVACLEAPGGSSFQLIHRSGDRCGSIYCSDLCFSCTPGVFACYVILIVSVVVSQITSLQRHDNCCTTETCHWRLKRRS